MTRFKCVFGDKGTPYMSADELFTLNPSVTKKVMVEQAHDANDYFVKSGWIVMACSGQTYSLNGSVALMTEKHEKVFFSHDLIRIIPKTGVVRSGYLLMTLGHLTLGRPLVIRNAYGTSIPHLDPGDISRIPIVRLDSKLEDEIADYVEMAAALKIEADELENNMTANAELILDTTPA